MLTKEYFVNGTTAEKVTEEGLKLYGKCMDDHTCDRALYLYPDGSMNVLEGDGMPAKESRAICIASYGADDGDYLDAAYEQIEEAIMSSIPEVEQHKIQDYMETHNCGIEAFKVYQPELFAEHDKAAREDAIACEREHLEEKISGVKKELDRACKKHTCHCR